GPGGGGGGPGGGGDMAGGGGPWARPAGGVGVPAAEGILPVGAGLVPVRRGRWGGNHRVRAPTRGAPTGNITCIPHDGHRWPPFPRAGGQRPVPTDAWEALPPARRSYHPLPPSLHSLYTAAIPFIEQERLEPWTMTWIEPRRRFLRQLRPPSCSRRVAVTVAVRRRGRWRRAEPL